MPMEREEADALVVVENKQRLGDVIRDAWGSLYRYRRDLAVMRRGTRASLVRDFMLDRALRDFYSVPGVSPIFRNGRFFLVFGGRLFVQLKKFNRVRRPSNYLTAQAVRIINQDPQGDLFPEYSGVTYATAGYRLNGLETQIEEVVIVCHDGRSELWALEIPEGPSVEQREPVVITPPPLPLSRIVRREPAPEQQVRTDDGAPSS